MRINMNDVDVQIENDVETFYLNNEKINGTIYCQYNSFCSFEVEVKDGVKNGVEKEYLNNEILTKTVHYKNGMEEGIGKEYDDAGKLKEEMYFEKGDLLWSKIYDENGKVTEHYESEVAIGK